MQKHSPAVAVREQLGLDNPCLRPRVAAPYLGISEATLFRYMKDDPDFPKGIKLSARCTVFRKSDLDAYLQRKASLSQAAA